MSPRIEQSSILLNVPLEIVYEVSDKMPLAEKILLSQTCRALWYPLRDKCGSAFREAATAERLECLATLAHRLPDRYFCVDCQSLHKSEPKDLPIKKDSKFYEPCLLKGTGGWSNCHRVHEDLGYSLAFRHVQLALKYTRMQNYHQDYRARLLEEFTKVYAPSESSKTLLKKFTAQPTIVKGRFLVMTELEYDNDRNTIPAYPTTSPVDMAMRSAHNAAKVGLPSAVFSCEHCPTDFMIMFRGKKTTFFLWQDFGTGEDPKDYYSRIQPPFGVWAHEHKFPHEHGSIREMYYNGETDSCDL